MIMTKYIPILKTGDAELRGLEQLQNEIKDEIVPLIELTKYRSISKQIAGSEKKQKIELPISKRIDKIEQALGNKRVFILDLTSDNSLTNEQIRRLRSSEKGFESWCAFLLSQKQRFPSLIPVIQLSEEGSTNWAEFEENRSKQLLFLKKHFGTYVYRFPAADSNYAEDLEAIVKILDCNQIMCCIDLSFIPQGKGKLFLNDIILLIQTIHKSFGISNFLVSGTSFPASLSEFTTAEYGKFTLEEVELFSALKKNMEKLSIQFCYSDYGCINPNRVSIMARGWIPKIDCPTDTEMFFYRKRKGKSNYADVYCEVAQQLIIDPMYVRTKELVTKNCWAIKMIEDTAKGNPPNLSPSFWISVRFNLAVTVRAKLLNLM